MRYFAFFFIAVLLVSCKTSNKETYENYPKHSIYNIENSQSAKIAVEIGNDKYLDTGILVNGKKQGPWVTYEDKSFFPKIIANYADDTLNGPYSEFKVGRLILESFYEKGKLEGEYKKYEEGILIKKQTLVNGEIEGEVMNYYAGTGREMSRLNYKNGLQDGLAIYYNEKGFAVQEYVYENGEQISAKEIEPE